ncbi:arginase [Alkalithermobacter thermoalcaliphilus JW-YL-7 = DSM 7308]|uniref:Arginase n=1 Tax=Alkalithermobacter thermoalcaliphilus JW-YL-7 = DSM 7308 TaxID=1121328 RepID=A0A150FNB7_CLOPD|nr:arginase [[Clostridium] paradoxum JW-YL-7 = DSM 7308]SHK90468.1 arginase [[Clostridium] paradoxum JW-YL-7 = DSM 7308]
MNINIIGVPLFYGCDKQGPQYAPDKLRENNLIDILQKHNHKVFDLGNIHVPSADSDSKFLYHRNMKYVNSIVTVNTNLAHLVNISINNNDFPLIIGGDHSLSIGSIAGVSKAFKNIAVIWLDAHADINTHETSPSGNVHGMPLGASMGIGHEDLTNLYYKETKVRPENVFILGARDIDSGEIDLIKEKNINVYSPEKMRKIGIENLVDFILDKLKESDVDAIHLSFDMDFIDSSYVPGTGTPVNNGFNVDETKLLLRKLAQTGMIKSMDFVELNTLLDENDKTLNLAIEILDSVFECIK